MDKKLSLVLVLLIFCSSAYASSFSSCKSLFYIDFPVIDGVDTSSLKESKEIMQKIQDQHFDFDPSARFILTFQYGDYDKDGKSMIASRMTVKSMYGKILYRSDREERQSDHKALGMDQLILMRKHVKELPSCKELSQYLN